MAAISAAGNGNWTSTTPNAPWPSGVVPTSADQVTIPSTRTVTLDGAASVDTLTIASGGTLLAAATGTLTLTAQNDITVANGGTMNLDVSAGTATLTVNLNASNNAAGRGILTNGVLTIKGASRTRWTRLNGAITAGATSAVVDDATGWAVGDTVVFATTQAYNATPRVDVVTLTSVSGSTIGWTGGITYDHTDNGRVGNFNSNATVRPNTLGQRNFIRCNANGTSPAPSTTIQQVLFNEIYSSTTFAVDGIVLFGSSTFQQTFTVEDCAFLNSRANGCISFYQQSREGAVRLRRNILHTVNTANYGLIYCNQTLLFSDALAEDNVVFRCTGGSGAFLGSSLVTRRFHASACVNGVSLLNAATVYDSEFEACLQGVQIGISAATAAANIIVENSSIGSIYANSYVDSASGPIAAASEYSDAVLKDCQFQATPLIGTSVKGAQILIANKNGDLDAQEFYSLSNRTVPTYKKQLSVLQNANASMEFAHTTSDRVGYAFQVLAKSGETITLKVNVRKSSSPAYGASTLPSVTVSGLGITPVVATMSSGTAADTWETLTVNATNTASADGLLTVTLAAQSATSGAKSWFSGIPAAPFVTRARHYGYLFNETIPTLLTNPYTVASEATAAAYTGVTINATTKRVSFGVGTADTLNKVYDYSQAWACLNIDKEVPWSRAGALLSLTSGWTVVDPAISGVTWGGGTIEYSTPGSITAAFDTTTIEFTTAGTYSMGDSVFAGNITLTNTSGGAVTVQLPAGTSYTNTGPSITVTTPVLYQSVTINGLVTGSRVYIYDTVTATVLANAVTGSNSYTWTDSVAASADRNIWLRVAYQNGASAKRFIDVAIGTCGTTALTAGVSYLVNQEDDPVYILNAIDGSTVAGISIDDAIDKVVISIAGGAVTWPEIYAYQVYWLATSAGIIDDAAFIAAPDTANYLLSGFQIRNTSSVPLTITGGYGRDADTETVAACIDTAGSTGNIYPAPDHVVPFSTGSGLTAGQAAKLESLDTQAVNLVSIKGQLINGTGSEIDPWGP